MDEYRSMLERCLAFHILQLDTVRRDLVRVNSAIDAEADALLTGEINGLCISLRLLGGYGPQAFDVAWATGISMDGVSWDDVLTRSYDPV